MEMKLASIDFSCLQAHGCKPWVANLLAVPHTLRILTANGTYYIKVLKYINESQVNAHVAQLTYQKVQ